MSITEPTTGHDLVQLIPNGATYLHKLQELLTPRRLQHSLEVLVAMEPLIPIYRLNPNQARTAALLHDVVKDFSDEELGRMAAQAGIRFTHPVETLGLYLHGPVGAWFIEEKLGIQDPLIKAAIHTHSYMRNHTEFHTPLNWCLRFADLLAEGRDWYEFKDRILPLVNTGNWHTAAAMTMGWVIELFQQVGNPIHPEWYVFLDESRQLTVS